jgi:DNA-binding CsgD family transcriptional regulator
MGRLGVADLEAILSLLEEAQAVEGPVPFTPELLDRFAELVDCEQAAYFEVDHPKRILSERITDSKTRYVWNGMPDDLWTCTRMVELNRYKYANGAGPVVLADVFSRRLRLRPDFNPNLRAIGAVDEIHVDLDPPRQWKAELAVYSSRDFGPRERLILQLVQPHLAALYRTAMLRRRLSVAVQSFDPDATAELTPRECDVMACVAKGLSNAQIATVLVVERSTVRKHLEHVYDKLGVRSRTGALATLSDRGR